MRSSRTQRPTSRRSTPTLAAIFKLSTEVLVRLLGAFVIVLGMPACLAPGVVGLLPDDGGAKPGAGCALKGAAFCETFDVPAGIGNRAGQLNGTIWGASRASGNNNIGQGTADGWAETPEDECGKTAVVMPEADINICNGRMIEATNDDGGVTVLAMSPKQPFDVGGRTGTVVFDVSDDSHGGHSAWPELWYTDQPVPAPLIHEDSWSAIPKDGLNIILDGDCAPNEGCGACPGVTSYRRVGYGGANVINTYVTNGFGMAFADSRVTLFDCVATPSSANELNHFEVHINRDQIDVFGTDAGTTTPLKKMVTISNVGLSLTRGYVSITDGHFDGNQNGPDQGIHTFAWDNVAFDGPLLPRDLAFDVPDNLVPGGTGNYGYPVLNLGYTLNVLGGATSQSFTIDGVAGIDSASDALLTFNFSADAGVTLTYSLNGHAPHVSPWPYPDMNGSAWRTIALPVPLAEVVAGTNTVQFSSTGNTFFADVDLVLVGAGGMPRRP